MAEEVEEVVAELGLHFHLPVAPERLLVLLCHKIFQFPRKFDGMG